MKIEFLKSYITCPFKYFHFANRQNSFSGLKVEGVNLYDDVTTHNRTLVAVEYLLCMVEFAHVVNAQIKINGIDSWGFRCRSDVAKANVYIP